MTKLKGKQKSRKVYNIKQNILNKSVDSKVSKKEKSLISKDKNVNKEDSNKTNYSGKRRLIIRNLSTKADDDSLTKFFSGYGEIEETQILKSSNGNSKGIAFIQFKSAKSAEEVVSSCNLIEFMERKLVLDFAIPTEQYKAKLSNLNSDQCLKENKRKSHVQFNDTGETVKTDMENADQVKLEVKKLHKNSFTPHIDLKNTNRVQAKKNTDAEEGRSLFLPMVTQQTTKEDLMHIFASFGSVRSVRLISNNSKAFVEFESKSAADACLDEQEQKMFALNGKKLKVLRALPKGQLASKSVAGGYTGKSRDAVKNEDTKEIKEEPTEDDALSMVFNDHASDSPTKAPKRKLPDGATKPTKAAKRSKKTRSEDVSEGRTLFVTNLSPETSESEVAMRLSLFGKLKGVRLCANKTTGALRAFAEFETKSDADTCLLAYQDPLYEEHFKLGDLALKLNRAIKKEEADLKVARVMRDKQQEVKKDKRNLYLSKEGVVAEESAPAKGLSQSDLILRRQRESFKRQMLKNLFMFVSPTRLFVCNIPLTLKDADVAKIFATNSPEDAVITECRIMRSRVEGKSLLECPSRGHGFVTFTEHEHALASLRIVNNNPKIFFSYKRPVVEFAIENRSVLDLREARQNSQHDQKAQYNQKTQLTHFKPFGTDDTEVSEDINIGFNTSNSKARRPLTVQEKRKISRNQSNKHMRKSSLVRRNSKGAKKMKKKKVNLDDVGKNVSLSKDKPKKKKMTKKAPKGIKRKKKFMA